MKLDGVRIVIDAIDFDSKRSFGAESEISNRRPGLTCVTTRSSQCRPYLLDHNFALTSLRHESHWRMPVLLKVTKHCVQDLSPAEIMKDGVNEP